MKDKKERMNRRTIITAIVVTLMSVSNVVRAIDAEREIKYCERQTEKALQALQPYDFSMMPRNILQGQTQWNLRKAIPEEWCSGFWTGILWMDYAHSRSEAVKRAAEQYTDAIEPIVAKPVYDHDLGFIVINSLLKGYEQTANPHYRALALQAAAKLATLFNAKVGTILSWPRHVKDYGGHNTIMDNMINLELLLWASQQTPADNPDGKRFYDIAVRHAETTMNNHFRPDGSCYHVAVYDTLTGRFLRGVTHQGYADHSMWSRGQAWAIYGYTMVYRYTRDRRFLDFAQKVTDIYLQRLRQTSDDMIPLWDMDFPADKGAESVQYKDASAACVVASALLELDGYATGNSYRKVAENILADLSTERYQSRDRNVAFLLHSTGHRPAGSEIDASIVYADYYYLEALLRLKALQTGYQMAGPYEVVARDGQYARSKGGSERDMRAALDFAQKGESGEALRIINAYAHTLQRLDGHDAPLCAIQTYWLVRAMTLLKDRQTPEWGAMIRRALVPMMNKFDADSPYANGNWGAIVNRLRMACGIFLDDKALYKEAVDYFLHANDNGSLPNYVSATGQCQETGRDQGHAQLGLGAQAEICEMAWEQGDDLWGALDNRLMKGMEYTARYNLGEDVPFETWTDCTGLYNDWTAPGEMGRGVIRDIYEPAYKHYVGRCGLSMPYTQKLLAIRDKAEKRGEVKRNIEADQFRVPGVKEGVRLHQAFTYPAPEGAPLKHDYDVFIQPRGQKEWTKIDTYMAKVNAPVDSGRPTGHRISEISYAFFDFTGDVFVRVVCKNRKYKTARIRPDYRGTIANVLNDSTVQFLLFQPENVSVEFDGDITGNLLLFTSKPPVTADEARKEAKKAKRNFVYYAPGLYTDKTIKIPSNTTVYLAGGSYFTGTFAIEDATGVSILGRGVARPADGYEGCHVHRSQQVLIDGLILNTCPVGGSNGVTLHDVRSISHPQWGDGLNVFASSNVLYDRVFCRNSDDCTTAYATRKGFSGSVHNVRMTNSTLWADVAHPIFIGLHGNPAVGDSIVQLRYDNIDIICQSELQVDYQGCLTINCGDDNYVKDVIFDNIRIEQIRHGCIAQVKVGWNQKYCTAPGRGIENVTFRNIRYYGKLPNLSVITGYDARHAVRNVTFEGLKINGRTIYDDMPDKPKWYATSDLVPMFVGSHVENLKFTK